MSGNPMPSKRTSQRSWEFIAIPVVLGMLGILGVIMLAANSGLAAWLAVGAIIVAVLGTVALVTMRRPQHPSPRSAGDVPTTHVDDGVHRVLVIADDTCSPGGLGSAVAAHGNGERISAFVIAPALASRVSRWTGDEHAYTDAAQHLDATLKALKDLDVDANGHVGSHDPLQAADDGLREFAADEIVFVVHPSEAANWLEQGTVDDARTRYPIPVSELTVGSSR